MNILGIKFPGHDTAAALVVDGEVVAAVEEERFDRCKHTNAYPLNAIAYCLNQAGLERRDIDIVALPINCKEAFESPSVTKMLDFFPDNIDGLLFETAIITSRLKAWKRIQSEFLGSKLMSVSHHLAHAATAFFTSGLERAAILTADGRGEIESMLFAIGNGSDIKPVHRLCYPHSLGFFYGIAAEHLGLSDRHDDSAYSFDGEGKLMGLAAYGTPSYLEFMRQMVILTDKGFELDLSFFDFHIRGGYFFSNKACQLLGPARIGSGPLEQHHFDVAASTQAVLEETLLHCIEVFGARQEPALCLGGGIALNCVANARIADASDWEKVHTYAACHDAGNALGAALFVAAGCMELSRQFVGAALGPAYDDREIMRAFMDYENRGNLDRPPDIVSEAAQALMDEKIVAWFQGRMEFGPRALGNRSILVDPSRPGAKDDLNHRIKFREPFRPFAPAVLAEYAHLVFGLNQLSPFMMFTSKAAGGWSEKIPGVIHVDGKARIQTVSDQNGLFFEVLSAFHALSGIPVLLNTSFNVKGEPIVNSPKEAFNCFFNTDIDLLFIGPYRVSKKEKIQ